MNEEGSNFIVALPCREIGDLGLIFLMSIFPYFYTFTSNLHNRRNGSIHWLTSKRIYICLILKLSAHEIFGSEKEILNSLQTCSCHAFIRIEGFNENNIIIFTKYNTDIMLLFLESFWIHCIWFHTHKYTFTDIYVYMDIRMLHV